MKPFLCAYSMYLCKSLIKIGHSIIVVEHNLDLIKCSDYIIDLGPEGGNKGGYIVAQGTPEEIVQNKKSHTGRYLKNKLKWISIKKGQILIFNQCLPHGNVVNKTMETRWSMNCRFKSLYSPYGDKKIGEFFEPITLRAASKIGMQYHLPKIND